MRNNEHGEFELVVGNRQLLSGFFIVVLLFAVAFAMGYVVGQNSPRQTRAASEGPVTNVTPPVASDRPQPLAPVTPPVSPTAGTPAPQTPPADATPQPSTQPAQAPPPAAAEPAPPATASTDLAAGSYWQLMAVGQSTAEAMRVTLKDKGFPVVLTPGPNNLTRVLVGPYADTATYGRAKTDLENAGMHP